MDGVACQLWWLSMRWACAVITPSPVMVPITHFVWGQQICLLVASCESLSAQRLDTHLRCPATLAAIDNKKNMKFVKRVRSSLPPMPCCHAPSVRPRSCQLVPACANAKVVPRVELMRIGLPLAEQVVQATEYPKYVKMMHKKAREAVQ